MPTGNANLVSVIIPSYNRASMLVEALESISAQTYRPLEIVVVDDGSTDDTSSVVKRWYAQTAGKGEGLSLLYLYQSNSGPSAARNNGAGHAHGEFLTFHDSDDLMDPERIAPQIAEMQRMGSDLCENTVSAILLSGVIHTAQMGDDRLLSLIRDMPAVLACVGSSGETCSISQAGGIRPCGGLRMSTLFSGCCCTRKRSLTVRQPCAGRGAARH